MSHDVFISYSSKDKTIADAVCAKLEGRKIRCWMAPRDIPAGQNFARSIIYAINDSKVFVLVWSASTNTSEHILNEINQAFDHGIPIIPFRIEEVLPTVEMRYYFGRTHWLDALTPPLEKHIGTLAQSIKALLESKLDNSQTPIPINNNETPPEKEKPKEIPAPISSQVPEKIASVESSPGSVPKTESVNWGKVEKKGEAVQRLAANSQKKRRLIPILAIGILAVLLGTLSLLDVFKGDSPFTVTSPQTSTGTSIQVTPTLRLTKATATPPPTKGPATATPTKKATPVYWATEFSGQIMTAIKFRAPNFTDDFSYWKTDWYLEDGTDRPDCKNTFSTITDGKLLLTSDIGECWSWARLPNLDLHNFVVQIDMDLQQKESMATIVISWAEDSGSFIFELAHDGNWFTEFCIQPESRCIQGKHGQLPKGYDTSITITVIFNGDEYAVFVNSIPIYHGIVVMGENSSIRHVNFTVQNGTKNIPIRSVEFDNLKIWDLDKIESLSSTPTKSN